MPNHQLLLGNCLDVLRDFPDNSIDSVVTDPPYGLTQNKKGGTGVKSVNLNSPHGRARISTGNGTGGFMGQKWDSGVPTVDIWAECLRVLKPGGNLLSFAGTRTQHRMVANILGAGFELQDIVLWTYGCLSEDSEVLTKDGWFNWRDNPGGREILIYDIVTGEYRWELPEKWYSYLVHNDVAYSIKSEATDQIVSKGHRCLISQGGGLEFKVAEELPPIANVPVLKDVDGGSYTISEATVTTIEYSGFFWCPTVSTGAFVARRNGKVFVTGNSGFPKSHNVEKAIQKIDPEQANRFQGIGTALKPSNEPISIFTKLPGEFKLHSEPKRLYYCAKAPKKERNLGLPLDITNTHPTVKPLKLMKQLCQLATPVGGTILDPFTGSGTTGIAALNMGYNFIGIDMGEEYFDIASCRLNSLFPKSEAQP